VRFNWSIVLPNSTYHLLVLLDCFSILLPLLVSSYLFPIIPQILFLD
jgi:hypothetical protein